MNDAHAFQLLFDECPCFSPRVVSVGLFVFYNGFYSGLDAFVEGGVIENGFIDVFEIFASGAGG